MQNLDHLTVYVPTGWAELCGLEAYPLRVMSARASGFDEWLEQRSVSWRAERRKPLVDRVEPIGIA